GTTAATHAASPWSPAFDSGYAASTSRGIAVGGCVGHACDERGCHEHHVDSHHSPRDARNSLEWHPTDHRHSNFRSADRFDYDSRYRDTSWYDRRGTFGDGRIHRGANASFDDWRWNTHQDYRQRDRPSTFTRFHGNNTRIHSPSLFEPWHPLNASNFDRLYR